LLVVEVADTSVELDRRVKMPLYAAVRIREMWLVDLVRGAIEIFGDPDATGYTGHRTVGRSDHVTPETFPDVTVAVRDILG
jgi:Uma2 family endonuclease